MTDARQPVVGDTVEHTNSHRIGKVVEVRPWRDGTLELRVHVEALDTWWNSGRVRNLTAEEEESGDGYVPLEECLGRGTHLVRCDDDGFCQFCGEQEGEVA